MAFQSPVKQGKMLCQTSCLQTRKEELVDDVKVGSSFDCIDHEVVELLRGLHKAKTRITALDLRRIDCGLLRDLLGKYTVLEQNGIQESSPIFRVHFI